MIYKVISLSVVCSLLFAACQSTVRFTSHNKTNKENVATRETGIRNENTSTISPQRSYIIKEAQGWIGTPYCYGGSSLDCTDCSGFVYSIYNKYGYNIPRTAAEQYNYTARIEQYNAQAGDLVFFRKSLKVTHVGIYLGSNKFIHASTSYGVISQSLGESNFNMEIAGFGRIVN